jgi:LysM repeat protein
MTKTNDVLSGLDKFSANLSKEFFRQKYFIAGTLGAVALIGGGKQIIEHMPALSHSPQEQPADPIPKIGEPHKFIRVKAGDTESAIAAREGHANDLGYINMLNKQLPEADQKKRVLRPGEVLIVPPS